MWTRPQFFDALSSQIETICESAAEVMRSAPGDYDDVPLVVISAGRSDERRLRADSALARQSTRGRHLLVTESGHWIPLDAPQAVIDAVVTMVSEIRHGREGLN
jgi:pimeloyl-ACP methyl ester carboxylesterase